MQRVRASVSSQPVLALALGILAVSTAAIFIRYAQAEAPSLVIAAYRLSLAALLIAPFALSRRRAELAALGRRDLWLALLSIYALFRVLVPNLG